MQTRLVFWIFLFVLYSCGQNSRQDRAPLGNSPCCRLTDQEIPESLIHSIDSKRLEEDWIYQRQSAWNVFQFLLEPNEDSPMLLRWQDWYTADDLALVFRNLYSSLSKDERKARRAFTPERADAEINAFDAGRKDGDEKVEQWFKDEAAKAGKTQVAQLERILFNRAALRYVLLNYEIIHACYAAGDRANCPTLHFPLGAAFIKTAWRRSGDGFRVSSFPSDEDGLHRQLESDAWTATSDWLPDSKEALTLTTESGQIFHLVGLHLTLRFPDQWLWASLWLSPFDHQALASDQPLSLGDRWQRYQLCSIYSFRPIMTDLEGKDWPPELLGVARVLQDLPSSNWCSNPFLELGSNNQKTNCIGCHQFAGLEISQRQLAEQLKSDPRRLQAEADDLDKGPGDGVWSLVSGPNALAFILADTIEYFDAYDPFETKLEE